jgi:hypothetical protein
MVTRFQKTTGLISVALLTFSLFCRQQSDDKKKLISSDPPVQSLSSTTSELDELRRDLSQLKEQLKTIEQKTDVFSPVKTILTLIQTMLIRLTSFSFSFLIYTFFLYLLHLSVVNSTASQTIKLLHIVNIIAYTVITIVYRNFQQIHYSSVAWLVLFLLLFSVCLH